MVASETNTFNLSKSISMNFFFYDVILCVVTTESIAF